MELLLFTVGVLFHVEWCIRLTALIISIIFYNITSIVYDVPIY